MATVNKAAPKKKVATKKTAVKKAAPKKPLKLGKGIGNTG